MQECPNCGVELRYIPAARRVAAEQGIYTVDAESITIVNEHGRLVTGYRQHKCGEVNGGKTTEVENKDSHRKETGN